MKIQLDKHYQNVNGVQLAPGIHEVQDNLAAYLVTNGHAVAVTPVASEPVVPEIDAPLFIEDDLIDEPIPAPKANKRK